MILPQTYAATIFLMILSMICWGSWASTYKASRWRFELYYFDFSFGLIIAAAILAFTVGSMGFDGFTFIDDLLHAGKRAWFFAVLAGVVFNLANMLLMAAISTAGMAVSYTISAGLALILGVAIGAFERAPGNVLLLFAGCALVVGAVIFASAVYRFITVIRHEVSARSGKAKSTRRPAAAKGIVLSLFSGLCLAGFFPLVERAKAGEIGVGPYATLALLACGVLFSSFILNLFFINLPVEGDPVDFMDYFRASPKSHGLAMLGGIVWGIGAIAAFTSASAENVHVATPVSYALSQASTLIAILWGVLVWKEFKDGDARIKSLIALFFVLFMVGVTLVSLGQGLDVPKPPLV